jgi:hypothetical protein
MSICLDPGNLLNFMVAGLIWSEFDRFTYDSRSGREFPDNGFDGQKEG